MEEFPARIDCPQCKRPYQTEDLQTRVNTLLTETLLTCPRCRHKLRQMRLKDWYDHYVQGQTPEPVQDEGTFATKMTEMPKTPTIRFQPGGDRPVGAQRRSQRPRRRGQRGGRPGPQQQQQRQAQQQQRPPNGNVKAQAQAPVPGQGQAQPQGPRPPNGPGGGGRRRRRRRRR